MVRRSSRPRATSARRCAQARKRLRAARPIWPRSCGGPTRSGRSVARIELTLPREREFSAVADLVLAGIASRLEVTLEAIDDLQLALETLLERDEADDATLTVRFDVEDGEIRASVGPFERADIEPEFAAVGVGAGIGLRRVLDSTVDGVELTDEDDGCWIELRKAVGR